MKSEFEIQRLRSEAEHELTTAILAEEIEQARYWLGVKSAYDTVLRE